MFIHAYIFCNIMTDQHAQANLTLEYLRRFDKRQAAMHEDILLIRDRLASLESQVSLIRGDVVRLEHRLDRIDGRMQRIEDRLELSDAAENQS